jgi:hypothetical protein
MRIIILSIVLAGCATPSDRICHYEGMKLSDRMAASHCEQALMRPSDYKTSSKNPYMQPNHTVTIQEQRSGIPTGRTYTVKR